MVQTTQSDKIKMYNRKYFKMLQLILAILLDTTLSPPLYFSPPFIYFLFVPAGMKENDSQQNIVKELVI